MISLTYISHHVINSNGLPSYFILTLAHRLFIIQPLLTSLNSLLVTLPIPHAVFSHPGLLAVLNTSQLILTLAPWYSLFSRPEMHFPLTVHGLLLHFIQSLCSNVTSFKKAFLIMPSITPSLPFLSVPLNLLPILFFFKSPVATWKLAVILACYYHFHQNIKIHEGRNFV